MNEQMDCWFHAVAAASETPAASNCSATTRPSEVVLTLSGIEATSGTTEASYTYDDWWDVRNTLNGEHVLGRTSGDSYSSSYSVSSGGGFVVTLTYEYRAADHEVIIDADPDSVGVTSSTETQRKTGLTAPYDCGTTLGTGFANVSTVGPDAAEGGLDFSSISITSSEQSLAPISGTLIYSLVVDDDITDALWDDYYDTLPLGTQGRPLGRNHIYVEHNTTATHQPYRLRANQNYEVPTLVTLGGVKHLKCDRSITVEQDDHSQVLPFSGSTNFEQAFYLKPNVPYRFDFTMFFEAVEFTYAQWVAHPWCIFLDFHPGTFPAGWGDTTNPFIALSVEGGGFRMRTRGSTQPSPGFYTRNDRDDWAFSTGEHKFVVETRFDYTGATGYCRCYMDGMLKAGRTGSVGMNHSASTTPGAMIPKFGCYTSTDGPITYLKDLTIRDET